MLRLLLTIAVCTSWSTAYADPVSRALSLRSVGPIPGGLRTLDVVSNTEQAILNGGGVGLEVIPSHPSGVLLQEARFEVADALEVVVQVTCDVPWRLRVDGTLLGAGQRGVFGHGVVLRPGAHQILIKAPTRRGTIPCGVSLLDLNGVMVRVSVSTARTWSGFDMLERNAPTALRVSGAGGGINRS